MNIRFEELAESQRAGGIEAATLGLVISLARHGVSVIRSSEEKETVHGVLPQVVHFHGIWSPLLAKRWRTWRALGIPCVMSLHGMAEPWALAHKALKKKVAWHLYQRPILNRASVLHATSAREAENLKQLGLTANVALIPWGIEMPEVRGREDDCSSASMTVADFPTPIHDPKSTIQNQNRTALFVGRIYPVKGLPMLVEAWSKLRPKAWKMKVVGPDEAGHLAEVKALVHRSGLDADFEFTGSLEGEALRTAYENADLYIQPSYTENFGMAIAEAMAHGLPVITTHGAPWKLLEEEHCGWWVPISVDGIVTALADATRQSPGELLAMGERGRAIVAERFAWDRIAGQFVECYKWLLGQGPRPECVEG